MRRLNWNTRTAALARVLGALRPYRGGSPNEPIDALYERILKQIGAQDMLGDILGDAEEPDSEVWRPDASELARLIDEGIALLRTPAANAKWQALKQIVDGAGTEKIVFFAQPVETVSVVAAFLAEQYGEQPAIIVGNQDEDERQAQVAAFQSESGPRFLVSSRAGGEGLNMQRSRRLVHLDVPWNPMDLEQRIGRIHRFGSRKTIIVDTVVAAGSREIDMYRIAREKLAMIATHLDPEQFESVFSRVMSLVPPKELENLLGGISSESFASSAATDLGRLVKEGYEAWRTFDEKYRGQAEQIRAVSPGEATWSDLAQFMLRFGDAIPGPDVSVIAFDFRNEEIVAVDERLPSILVGVQLFACGDTGGLAPDPVGGTAVRPIGLNVPEVANRLKDAFAPAKPAGAAYLRRPAELATLFQDRGPVWLLGFLRQSIHQELGRTAERSVSLHIYAINTEGDAQLLSDSERTTVVRACAGAVRLREPALSDASARLVPIEFELARNLKRPTSDDVELGLRHVVWPICAIALL